MWEEHKDQIEKSLGPNSLLLDIGGWANPMARADYVLDVFPYETRGIAYNGIGRLPTGQVFSSSLPGERFTKKTWIVHDICSGRPSPFPDRMFDFVVCSHTLEDIRDPIRACQEIIRIGKAGYIETPARTVEQTIGLRREVGATHHRWLVEIEGNRVTFRHKPHHLHTDRRHHVPPRFLRRLPPKGWIAYLFWEGSFEVNEALGYDFYGETARYVENLHVPPTDYWLDRLSRFRARAVHGLRGLVRPLRQTAPPADGTWTWDELFEANRRYLAAT